MELTEGEGSSGTGFTEIATNADSLDASVVFHIIKDTIGFVLYMHQQIPSVLQDICREYDGMRTEYKELEMDLTQTEFKASLRRKHVGRMREIKQGIRRLEKFMNTISSLQTALQSMIREFPNVQEVILVLGPNPIRPRHVYEMCFTHDNAVPNGEADFSKTKAGDALSRKAIRVLISKDAGSASYPGPTKLFLLVKAPSSFNMPSHFLPKRDFRYSKKIVPFRLRFRCRTQCINMDAPDHGLQTDRSISLTDSTKNELIWFQCRHVIKGIACKTQEEE